MTFLCVRVLKKMYLKARQIPIPYARGMEWTSLMQNASLFNLQIAHSKGEIWLHPNISLGVYLFALQTAGGTRIGLHRNGSTARGRKVKKHALLITLECWQVGGSGRWMHKHTYENANAHNMLKCFQESLTRVASFYITDELLEGS